MPVGPVNMPKLICIHTNMVKCAVEIASTLSRQKLHMHDQGQAGRNGHITRIEGIERFPPMNNSLDLKTRRFFFLDVVHNLGCTR